MSSAPERTFARNRGCYSCKSFANEGLAQQHWAVHRRSLLARITGTANPGLLGDLENPLVTSPDPRVKQIVDVDRLVKSGCVGICMKGPRPASMGGPEGEFVAHAYLCDRWDGRDGHSLATAGRPIDKLNEELQIIALERVTKG